jgi:hypothetical protein
MLLRTEQRKGQKDRFAMLSPVLLDLYRGRARAHGERIEKRRSNKVLDTLKKEYRRMSTAHRGQHKTQRGVRVSVVVDIENFFRASKTFHQSRELTPVAQAVDFESH